MDINQGDTLHRESAREDKDEKHICPLQLEVIRRCIELWTNEGDVVFDPFSGIGSVPFEAVRMGRFGMGCELKDKYYEQGVKNLMSAERQGKTKQVSLSLAQSTLFFT
jgi:DNA modification methylase